VQSQLDVIGSFVSAHHGEAGMYALDQTTRLEGIVREVRWGNPHVIVSFDVSGADGVEQWAIELSSITTMQAAGATRDSLATGDAIVVTAHRHRKDKLFILPRSIQKPDGATAIQVPVRRSIFPPSTP
jgi:hypothetical protein